ncbi:MAG: G8 domain-containing protein [Pseudomonadota bacterium]
MTLDTTSPIIVPEPGGTTVGTDGFDYFNVNKGSGGESALSYTVFGEDGDDIFSMGNGDDVLFGGEGNDSFFGDGGNDVMTGGEGNDKFTFYAANGRNVSQDNLETDVITDFSAGDVIEIYPVGPDETPIKDVIQIVNTADGALISFSGNRNLNVELPGVNAEDLVVTPLGLFETSVTIELAPSSGTQPTNIPKPTATVAVEEPGIEPAPESVADTPVEPVEPNVEQRAVVDLASFDKVAIGDDGNDNLRAGNSDDYMEGGAGADRLNGQKGDDVIDGGEGDDYLIGHQGSDTGFTLTVSNASDSAEIEDGAVSNDALEASSDNIEVMTAPDPDASALPLPDEEDMYGSADEPYEDDTSADPGMDHGGMGHDHGGRGLNPNADASMQREHKAFMELIPVEGDPDVVTAQQMGAWSDPDTWGGTLPTDGQSVLIPEGISVYYDMVSDTRLDTVGVAGELHFARDEDTKMVVDSLLGTGSSLITIGEEGDPVAADVRTEIVIHADDGPIDPGVDPMQMGRGIVSMGETRIEGADKEDVARAIEDPMAGDASLQFDGVPDGWQVGDTLVITGTRYQKAEGSQDEVRTITAIEPDGTVRLDEPLVYNHDLPDGYGLELPVANHTRNVLVRSENPDDLDDRGHIMFMHNSDISVRNMEIVEMGRTDKSVPIDDRSAETPFDVENHQGRYALHIHRAGVAEPGGENEPAVLEGNAVWGSPGWGIVHHDSHANVNFNVVHGVDGGGIIAESGNETGEWVGNMVSGVRGNRDESEEFDREGGATHRQTWKGEREDTNDTFSNGVGMGMAANIFTLQDNIVTGSNLGMNFNRGTRNSDTRPGLIDSDPEVLADQFGFDPFIGETNTQPTQIYSRGHSGTEFYGNNQAYTSGPEGSNKVMDANQHMVESAVFVGNSQAVSLIYQKPYVFKDILIHGNGVEADGFVLGGSQDVHVVNSVIHDIPVVTAVGKNKIQYFDVELIDSALHNGDRKGLQEVPDFEFGAEVDVERSDLVVTGHRGGQDEPNIQIYLTKTDGMGEHEIAFSNTGFSWEWRSENPGVAPLSIGDENFPRDRSNSWWEVHAERYGFYEEPDGTLYIVIQPIMIEELIGSIGTIPVRIELDVNREDYPELSDDNLNGRLPEELRDNPVGEFRVLDLRTPGTIGPQNDDFAGEFPSSDTITWTRPDGTTTVEPPMDDPVTEEPTGDPEDPDADGPDQPVDESEVTEGMLPPDGAIVGTDGDDRLFTNGDDNVILGEGGNDHLRAGNNADYMDGGDGDDRMNGRRGDDVMYGGEGDDYLIGHQGSDTMTGGEGADTFDISSKQKGTDVITDFEVGVDTLRLDKVNYEGEALAQLFGDMGTETDGDMVLELDSNSTLILEGVTFDMF